MKYVLGLLLASSLLVNHNVEAAVAKCSDCSVFATGKDGTYWGWEDDGFCRIPSSCKVTYTKTTTVKKTTTTTKKSSSTTKKSTTTKKTSTTTKKTTTTKKSTVIEATTTIKPSKSTEAAATSTSASSETDANGNAICSGCVVTGTGGDNSLWGWENEKSCIIDQKKCSGKITEENKTDDSGKVVCKGCTVTATGKDGSYWGWENENSCIIDNAACKLSPPEDPKKQSAQPIRGSDGILICSTCEYTTIEPDTTTWNTENGEKCRVIGSRCGFNKTPHPWCSGCVVTGTGGDGGLYGWENSSSCVINEIECGFVASKPGAAKVEVESGAEIKKYINIYGVIATLFTILILRGY